jgi:hypothetical protein
MRFTSSILLQLGAKFVDVKKLYERRIACQEF